MPQVIITPEAGGDIKRLFDFLVENGAEQQAKRLMALFKDAFKPLANTPNIGRHCQVEQIPNARECIIKFGQSGYIALYSFDNDFVLIHAIRHQKELGYQRYMNSENTL